MHNLHREIFSKEERQLQLSRDRGRKEIGPEEKVFLILFVEGNKIQEQCCISLMYREKKNKPEFQKEIKEERKVVFL